MAESLDKEWQGHDLGAEAAAIEAAWKERKEQLAAEERQSERSIQKRMQCVVFAFDALNRGMLSTQIEAPGSAVELVDLIDAARLFEQYVTYGDIGYEPDGPSEPAS